MAGVIFGSYGIFLGVAKLNAGDSWNGLNPYYQKPVNITPTPTPTPPAAFTHPDFTDGSTQLLPQTVWIGVYEQRNDTLVWTETYSGLASGLPATAVVAPVGAAYTYTQPGFVFYNWGDSGSIATGAFNDGRVRSGVLNGAELPNVGHTVIAVSEYRSVAASVVVRAMLNNTATTVSASVRLCSKGSVASNLSITITPSQAFADANAKWMPYYDKVNASRTTTYIGYVGNWTTSALGATYLNVYTGDGVKLTATAVLGSTNLYYALPGSLDQSGVTINAYWTAAAVAASAGLTGVPTEKFANGLAPTGGFTL